MDLISDQTYWRILLFIHFLLSVGLLAAVTLQVATLFMPVRQLAGVPADRSGNVSAAGYTTLIVILYVVQMLFGAWVYIKYRTYVRIPMEELKHWWTVGSFEFKEHILAMGLGLLPVYWYLWRQLPSPEYAAIRRWITVFLAISVWYAFIVGHVANDFRGVGS